MIEIRVERRQAESLPFDPATQGARLAQTQLEVAIAFGAADLTGVEVEKITDPKLASDRYRDYVTAYNSYCESTGRPFSYGIEVCRRRALEVVTAGGALLVLAGNEMSGLERFDQMFRRSMAVVA